MFICTTPLIGIHVGLIRSNIGNSSDNFWHFAEIRAYIWIAFDSTNILSSNFMPNASLENSVRINEVLPSNDVGGIKTDDFFLTGPHINCWWMMNLGSKMHVKVVLVIGDVETKANTQDWKLTVGDHSDPLMNPQVFPSTGTSSEWAREVKVDTWG